MNQKQLILIDPRAYNYMKTAAVQNVEDALIELITNADDAYDRANVKNKYMEIEVFYPSRKEIQAKKYGKLIFRDNATGLTGEQMKQCFLQVGKFTSDKNSRGFFSRGAKDISSLGLIVFETIKDGLYSCVTLDSDSYGEVKILDAEVTEDIRNKLKMNNNGLQVSINFLEKIKVDHPQRLAEHIPKIVSLRTIFANKDSTIKFIYHLDGNTTKQILNYTYPKGEILMVVKYEVPGYNTTATLKILRSPEQLERHVQKKYNEFGLLIKSEKVIHDIDSFDHQLKFDPDIQYFWGYIECPKINELMREFDTDKKNKKNPFPIIDPNRINGINKQHPFYRALIQLPIKRLKLILEEMDEANENESLNNVDISKLTDILKDLNIVSTDFVNDPNGSLSLFSDPRGKLIRAIESERGQFVKVEKNFFMNVFSYQGKETAGKDFPQGSKEKGVLNKNNQDEDEIDEREKELDVEGGDEDNPKGEGLDNQKLFREVGEDEVGDMKKLYIYDHNQVPENAINESSRYINARRDSKFRIIFKKDPRRDYKFEIKRRISNITVKINIEHHLIRDYYTDENMDLADMSPEGLIILQQILTEAFTRLLLQHEAEQSTEILQSGSGEELVEKFITWKDKKEKVVEKLVYAVIRKLIKGTT